MCSTSTASAAQQAAAAVAVVQLRKNKHICNKTGINYHVKNPVLGKVKTRLAADIGDEQALKIYQELLQHTLAVSKNIR